MANRPASDISILLQLEQIPPAPFRKPRAKPTYRPHAKFTAVEDARLRELVAEHGASSWRAVAKLMPGRTTRQCRERWINYLDPALNTNAWTSDEDALLERTYAAIGPRWVCLTQFFPTRTDAMLKNRFQVLQRKHRQTAAGTPQSPDACAPIGLWLGNNSKNWLEKTMEYFSDESDIPGLFGF
jgi:hypothetical protein